MAAIINASTSSGLIQTADTSGVLALQNNGTTNFTLDASGNAVLVAQATAPSLTVNRQLVMNLTSDTNLRISVRGADGTTRVANITLA